MAATHISLRAGTTETYRAALVAGTYAAMRETFAVPVGDRFTCVREHNAANRAFDPDDLGIRRSDSLVISQITAGATRGTTQKRDLYAAVAREIERDPGMKPGGVLINLIEVSPEDWPFGNGLMSYAPPEP